MTSYLLYPFGDYDLQNKIFESPYGILRDVFAERGIQLQTYDQAPLGSAAKVLCFNHRPEFYASCIAAGLKPEQLVLFLMEPRPVIPAQYEQAVWNLYGQVFTFLDSLADGKHFKKMYYPQGQSLMAHVPGWGDRKFLSLMNANKYSYVPNELYSRRRDAIRFFESQADFDLFGHGWDRNGAITLGAAGQAFRHGKWLRYITDVLTGFRHSPSYRGTVKNKYETIQQYKYCIAFENESKTQGYMTEKLFDCLFTGTVPVYLGAENVTDYVPADCFIDMRKYTTWDELYRALRAISQSEFEQYQAAGQAFLRSPAFAPWLPQNVFQSIADQI